MGDRIACTALKLTGDLTTGAYGFAATVTDDWSFDLGTVPLALTEVGFAIDYDPSAGTSGEVVGTFLDRGLLAVRARELRQGDRVDVRRRDARPGHDRGRRPARRRREAARGHGPERDHARGITSRT